MKTKQPKMKLSKVVKGLYMDTKNGVTLEHEFVWSKAEGRKWVASWKVYGLMGLGAAETRKKKFDTVAEGLAFLRRIVSGELSVMDY